MEQISLSELFAKHDQSNFAIQQVCQLITKDNTLYEFMYDDNSKKAILDVVRNAKSSDYSRTTYQFDNKDISIYEALEMYGLKSIKLELDNVFDSDPSIWSSYTYLASPVNGAPLAQGKLQFEIATT